MLPKPLLLACLSLVFFSPLTQGQILKKIKDKVNKTINNNTSGSEKSEADNSSTDSGSSNSNNSVSRNEDAADAKWCDALTTNGGSDAESTTKDGVEYKKIFSSEGKFSILYDESSLKLSNDSKGHRLVLSERVNNKNQFKLVENGKVVATGPAVKPEWVSKPDYSTSFSNEDGKSRPALSKYIVGDTMKQNIPKSDAKTVSVQEVDDDQLEMALAVARQTEDYQNMSDEEKKEFEKTMRDGIARNNSMAGTKYDIPAQQGGAVAIVNGYFVVVKGKKYGKFLMPPTVEVSKDESKVFIVGLNEQSKPMLIANGKTTMLDANRYAAMGGHILKSNDGSKFVYIEQKKMSEKELEELSNAANANKRTNLQYNVLRPDGSSTTVTDYTYSAKFRLTNSGAVVYINEETGEVLADNKSIGKFPLKNGERLQAESVLFGSDNSKIAYYNGSEGSLTYLDGSVKKLDIIYPSVITDGGKSYLSWFRKCGNDIYIARFAY